MAFLEIDGLVARPRQFGFDDLRGLPEQVADVSLLVAGRQGGAVPLRALLAATGVDATASHVTLMSSDGGFSASVPLAAVRDALVVYRLGEGPLPAKLGGPLRFLIPQVEECEIGGVDACANVKFLASIRLGTAPGTDTRPTTPTAHAELHRKQST